MLDLRAGLRFSSQDLDQGPWIWTIFHGYEPLCLDLGPFAKFRSEWTPKGTKHWGQGRGMVRCPSGPPLTNRQHIGGRVFVSQEANIWQNRIENFHFWVAFPKGSMTYASTRGEFSSPSPPSSWPLPCSSTLNFSYNLLKTASFWSQHFCFNNDQNINMNQSKTE